MKSSLHVFLSHSSSDKELATIIAGQLELEVNVAVFVSSRPASLSSGKPWFDGVLSNLDVADVLVVLITVPSENSVWVGFELGYFWKKTEGKRIFALYHPTAKIPSPLDRLQGKKITDEREMEDFFEQICVDLGSEFLKRARISEIVEVAKRTIVEPPDRTMEKFIRLLDTAEWRKCRLHEDDIWICSEDATYQITVDYERSSKFTREEWVLDFPDQDHSKYVVTLKIVGVPIQDLDFVSLDGGRYFVPLPEIENIDGKAKYYWIRDSLIFKVGKQIATFYSVWPTFEEFAHHAGIEIRP